VIDPLPIGRSLVVRPGQSVPAAFARCPRVRLEEAGLAEADRLARAWRERRSLVVELSPGLGLDDPAAPPTEQQAGHAPWEWTVETDLPRTRLHHALWSNALDGREGPTLLRWRWGALAAGLGLRPAPLEAPGDVLLADGRLAVCDGGPFDADLPSRIGVAVLPAVSLEHGRTQPLVPSEESRSPVGVGGLSAAQERAVREPLGTVRVLAPAGSGKTRVLTERARWLCRDLGLPVAAVTLVAYNVRAAEEMRSRLADLPDIRVRTLNALGLRLSRAAGTIDEIEVRRILSRLVRLPRRAEADPLAGWIEALSRLRLGLRPPAVVAGEIPGVDGLEEVARAYREELRARNVVDFDEQVVRAIENLLADPLLRARSQRQARVVLVDEFQDLTPAHLLLLRLLVGPGGALFAVGDDDQTIYGYAGASPEYLVDFGRFFPGARTHLLEVNYRCPPKVVEAAGRLLARNRHRVDKTLRAPESPSGPGSSALVSADGPGGPTERSVARVCALLAAGAAPSEIAVLARVQAALAPVQVLLHHRGVARQAALDRRFLARRGVRAALAWIELATVEGPFPPAALIDAARHPRRGMRASLVDLIGRQADLGQLRRLADWLDRKQSGREGDKVREFAADLAAVRRAARRPGTTRSLLEVVRRRVGEGGLESTATSLDGWAAGGGASHLDDLDALGELAEVEPDPARFPSFVTGALAVPSEPDGVTLATIHAVKGREWPHVVLHQLTEGVLPHRLARDLEEERRVFHVALTRAGRSLTLVPGRPPSRFVAEVLGRETAAEVLGRETSVTALPSDRSTGDPAGRAARATDRRVSDARPPVSRTSASRSSGELRRPSAPDDEPEPALVARLREWRLARAAALAVPAYVVFSDRTLIELASRRPETTVALAEVRGIGPRRLEAYGAEILALCHPETDARETDARDASGGEGEPATEAVGGRRSEGDPKDGSATRTGSFQLRRPGRPGETGGSR
jgi:DNA helicase-2/ATP-dependent DNA helicase PcrA